MPCSAQNLKLIYKRYASLYFLCGVDAGDNELVTLEIIHSFVEVRAYSTEVDLCLCLVCDP